MEAVIWGVFTCSSRGCLAAASFRLVTDPACHSVTRRVYPATFYHMGKSDRVQAPPRRRAAQICMQVVGKKKTPEL